MIKAFTALVFLLFVLGEIPALGDCAPVSDPTYIQHDDFLALNWHILASEGAITGVPPTPSGSTSDIRLYSAATSGGGPSGFSSDWIVPWPSGPHDITGSSAKWFGMQFNGAGGTLSSVLSVGGTGGLLPAIQQLTPGAVTPVFAFDQQQAGGTATVPGLDGQTQENTDKWATVYPDSTVFAKRDIWLRGRLILIPKTTVASLGLLDGLHTAGDVDAALAPHLPAPTDAINTPGVDGATGIVVFYFRDMLFKDFTDPTSGFASGFDWSYLPASYNPHDFDPSLPDITAVDNIGGAGADWGGYLPGLNLTKYLDYNVFMSVESFNNNDGKEEIYIPCGIVPEPVTMFSAFLAISGLGVYIRRRVKA